MTSTIARPASDKQRALIAKLDPTAEIPADVDVRYASRWIDSLLQAQRDRVAQRRDEPAKLEPGVYELDGVAYVVKPNREGTRLYAKKIVEIGGTRVTDAGTYVNVEFEYEPGAVYRLAAEHKMDYDRAHELTLRYGKCIACSRVLKAAQSVDDGIGPVCKKKFR